MIRTSPLIELKIPTLSQTIFLSFFFFFYQDELHKVLWRKVAMGAKKVGGQTQVKLNEGSICSGGTRALYLFITKNMVECEQ